MVSRRFPITGLHALSRNPQHRLSRDAARDARRAAARHRARSCGFATPPCAPRTAGSRSSGPRTTTRGSSRGRPAEVTLDAAGRAVVPGLVDAHTHPVWLGDRGAEIATPPRRRELRHDRRRRRRDQRHGARDARRRPTTQLASAVRKRLDGDARPRHDDGRGQVGIRADRAGRDPCPRAPAAALRATAPAPPRADASRRARGSAGVRRNDRAEWVGSSPKRSCRGPPGRSSPLFCDVFCEQGVFTVEESRTILAAARREGLGLRVHADELARSGGADARGRAFGRVGRPPALHRGRGDRGPRALGHGRRHPSGNRLVDALAAGRRPGPSSKPGVPVAVASDANPGTCCTESLAAVAAHACLDSGLSVEETLTGMTLNAAASLGLAGGSRHSRGREGRPTCWSWTPLTIATSSIIGASTSSTPSFCAAAS